MLVGLSPASTPDLGTTVAKDWKPMYRFMLASLSSVIISEFGPNVTQDSPANVSIYVDRPMYRSMLTGQCIDLCWLACFLPVSLILVSPAMLKINRPLYRSMLAILSSAGISDIGPTAPGLPAGNISIDLCQQASLLPVSF